MPLITKGTRELSLRFETFPERAHARLQSKITELVAELETRVEAAAPFKTGKLRSEITPKVYGEKADRIAGYVSVYAPGSPGEYAKAATLEYGSNKVRRIFAKTNSILDRLAGGGKRRRIVAKVTKAARIQAFAYLRGPLEQMRPEIEAALDEVIAEVAAEVST